MRIRGGRSNDPFAGLSSINLEGLRYRLVDAENQVAGAAPACYALCSAQSMAGARMRNDAAPRPQPLQVRPHALNISFSLPLRHLCPSVVSIQVVGRLAAQLSLILQGKDKPTWNPLTERGDVCIVINGGKAALTGKKWADKVYVSHTGVCVCVRVGRQQIGGLA